MRVLECRDGTVECRDELRNWDHYNHRDYDVIIERLYEEIKDKPILIDFRTAEGPTQTFTITS
ncbi:hypothetical protein [Vulcanisaeta distributa]|uniref:hypothetical protein n=1 Tax=Vulcanisaeta distributa TaxID=164451 RepID=UPI001FB1B073|nr:hypothetical protein [Vulcanisaeta distributa]